MVHILVEGGGNIQLRRFLAKKSLLSSEIQAAVGQAMPTMGEKIFQKLSK
jgi:hypothetical protein